MICKICSEPVGLIHNCKPPVASDVEQKSPMQIATKALMMADAGYPIDPVVLVLAQAVFDCRKLSADNAIQQRLDHG